MKNAIIVSVSSDIGTAVAKDLLAKGTQVVGSFRTASAATEELENLGVQLIHCDFSQKDSVLKASKDLLKHSASWDQLIVCPATQEPFGPFEKIDFEEWRLSIDVNFTNQMQFLRELLPFRNTSQELEPLVLFFAGGGPNKATKNYSAYSVSKVALIKMCELLDAEIEDTRFVIVNPGWVKTKSQHKMLEMGKDIGVDFERTLKKFESDDWTPVEDVVKCCRWVIDTPRELVGGRYFGVEFDSWEKPEFVDWLRQDSNLCKMRRREEIADDHP